jgi:hypothetical protein
VLYLRELQVVSCHLVILSPRHPTAFTSTA